MDPFRYPSNEGAEEVALKLGVSLEDIMRGCQDWEYTYPRLPDLPEYERIYALPETSDLAKRVLGCFIFECLELHMSAGGTEAQVRRSLSRLLIDHPIHRHEFRYWAQMDNDHYTAHPEDGWHIMMIVREMMPKTEETTEGTEG